MSCSTRTSLALGACSTLACSAVVAAANADLILDNGKIVTVDKVFSIRQAIAVKGGRITALASPHDTHDWDAVETPVLIDGEQASLNGYFFLLDRWLTGIAQFRWRDQLAASELQSRYRPVLRGHHLLV
jgi:hypothetical protein